PCRIVADRVDDSATPYPIASGNLRRQTRQWHQRVHEIGMQLAPEPGVHSAHRGAHHEPRVIYAEPFREQAVLCFDHVEVTVAWKFRVHAVAWLGRFAVTDSVR